MAPPKRSRKGEPEKQQESHDSIPPLEFYMGIEKGTKREIRRRIAANFYRREDVIRETARKIIKSGDLPDPG